ncbi:hypothetical protein O181_013693 [Austropuccinia psidii MF-1]|uniref:Reverse transcriptase domain-containing protein n=1 Tax=Austropuccinia psidii MF-1 TaxID=1389203 RepID=A0A9Q3GNC7_9BASI|nr:hypothetical protein [Austropuccinia psidii MF-1]
MDVNLELDTRYHERQKEKRHHQEKKLEASQSNSSHPQNSPTSSQSKKNFQKRDNPHYSLLNMDFKSMNSEKERRIKEGLSTYWGSITLKSDHKDYDDPSRSLSNDFSSARSCAPLIGDSRKPSRPSSVHIPSFNSHQSLLSFRDEVFKEIQDVEEDNYVSSLHLFFENIDLLPSSYHDSVEELWDEEEEPEEVKTVMKVSPCVYHQYLYVFSKVEAEKLPPHCPCDHHIKLERSFPPVGVINSLSNQESDTLRAFISDNVENRFIQPSSSSTLAPVLFVKKKDGGLHLCVNYRKFHAVTRKNKYPVPPMNQILNFFNGSSIFSKINLRGEYNLLRIKDGDEHLTAFRTKYGGHEL